jgi:class 3 adenylate cyclase
VELETISWANLTSYFLDSSGHLFILLASLMFGLLLGFREIQLDHYLILLRRIATRLQQVSEWSLSPEMLAESMADETALQQRRVQRTVLFMDIRGFTKWSESKSPEAVVTMLNQFYGHAEEIISTGGGMKPHFIGDEVMTWFEASQKALETAVSLQQIINKQLEPVGLSVGIGIHQGEVVEGLLGSSTTKQYDIIGDAVNTASRLMAAAASKQLLVSETVMPASRLPGNATPITLQVKGKSQPLQAYALA